MTQRAETSHSPRKLRWGAYLLALLSTAATGALRFGLASWFGERPALILFVLPIFLSCYVGGLGPGLLATALAALGTSYFLLPPLHSFAVGSAVDTWNWLILIVVGVSISTLTEARQQHTQREAALARQRGDFLPERRGVRVGFAFALACLGVVGVISFTSVTRLSEEADHIRHTEEVIANLRSLLSTTTDVETAQRGYAITGELRFLEPYAESRLRIDSQLRELRTLTLDNQEQQRRLDRLEPAVRERIEEADRNVELRRSQGFASAQAAIASGHGKLLHDRLRAAVAEMEATERTLLRKRAGAARHSATLTRAVISFGSALAFGCVAVALSMISRDFAGGRRAQSALHDANDELEARVQERTAALRRSEARLGGIVGSAMDAIISVNSEQRVVLFNAAAEKLFGCLASAALGQALDQFIPTRFRAHHGLQVAEFGRKDVTARPMRSLRVLAALRADGTEFPIEASISQIEVEGEKLYTVVLRDITERKRAEDASALLAALVDSSSDAIVSKDLQGTVTSWNAGAERMFGYSAEEMVHRPITLLIPAERRLEEDEILAQIRRGERVEHFETLRRHKAGGLISVSVTVSPIKDAAGQVVGASKVARDISERKRAELALRESQAALGLTLDAAKVGYWDLNLLTHSATRSQQYDQVFGYPQLLSDWSYETFLSHVLAEDRERVDQLFQAGVATKTQWDFECRIIREDGALRWIWAHGNVFSNAEGEAERMLGMVSDITERKASEARSTWLASFPERNPSSIVELDPVSGIIHYANPAALRQFPDLEREGLRHPLLADLQTVTTEFTADGTLHRELTVGDSCFTQLLTYIDEARRVRIYSTDISARRNAEQALRARDAELHAVDRRLAEIVQGMTEGCFALDADWRFSFVNDRAVEMIRRDRSELLGRSIWDALPSLVGTPAEVAYRRAMSERVPVAGEAFSPIAKRWLDVRLFPTGEGLAAFLLDIHARKMAELDRERFVSLAENSHEFIGMRTLQGDAVFVNKAALALVGLDDLEQAIRTPPGEFFFPEDQAFIRDEFVPKVMRDGHAEVEIRFRHFKTGEAIWMIYNAFVVRDSLGVPTSLATVSRNITERKRAEQEVQRLNADLERRVVSRTNQLEAANKELEAFSYSVSHDLRAPLRAIDGFSRIVLEDYGPQLPDEAREHLETVCAGARRMGMLIDDLLSFARLSRLPLTKRTVDTQRLVSETLSELKAAHPGREIEFRLAELPECEGDPALLKQVWLNLLSNAVKYTSRRERALIEIGATQELQVVTYFVRDNGTGFDMRYAAKLFGVFQRLHRQEEFEGTGVGLAIVQRIVNRHGGRVWADAAENIGATFSFTLSGDAT